MISQNEAKPSPFELIFKTAPHIAEEVAKNFDRKFRFNVLKYVSKGFHEAVGRIDKKNYLIKIEGDKNVRSLLFFVTSHRSDKKNAFKILHYL